MDFDESNSKQKVKEVAINHQQSTDAKKSTQCPDCDRKFYISSAFRKHMKDVHFGFRHNCEECDKSFSTKFNLKYHVNAIHRGETFICNICKTNFNHKEKLVDHVKIVHEDFRYKCENCEKEFVTSGGLQASTKA